MKIIKEKLLCWAWCQGKTKNPWKYKINWTAENYYIMVQLHGIRINQNGYQVSFDSQMSMPNHFESQAIQPVIPLISFCLKITAMFYQQLIITCHSVLSTIYFHHTLFITTTWYYYCNFTDEEGENCCCPFKRAISEAEG